MEILGQTLLLAKEELSPFGEFCFSIFMVLISTAFIVWGMSGIVLGKITARQRHKGIKSMLGMDTSDQTSYGTIARLSGGAVVFAGVFLQSAGFHGIFKYLGS